MIILIFQHSNTLKLLHNTNIKFRITKMLNVHNSMSKNSIKVIDGGFSTQISKYDKSFEKHPLWTSWYLYSNLEIVYKTHLDYIRAGADIIKTNTYQASLEGFKQNIKDITDIQCLELIEKGVKVAQRARTDYLNEINFEKKILIAGSVGPYGAYLSDGSEYTGSYVNKVSRDSFKNWYKPKIEALIRAGADILAFETMPASKEAEILVELLKDYPGTKAWLTFSCKDGEHTNSGEKFQLVAKKCYDLNPEQIIAVGVNCTSPQYIDLLFKDFNIDRKEPVPLIVYPNSGEKYDIEKGWTEKDKCKPLESYVNNWINLGVKYIGGCCRTNEENIKKIREEVDKYLNKNN